MNLKGEKVQLRALEPTDLELLYEWENDTSVWEISHTIVPFSKFVLHQYLENQHLDIYSTKQLRLVIQDSSNRPVGLVDLFDFDPKHRRAGAGVLINSQEDRRKGYAKEALELLLDYCENHLNLHQVYANVGVSNQASMILFRRLGFVEAGVKKQWLKKSDGFEDEALLQLIFS